jgi:hypothetical protein
MAHYRIRTTNVPQGPKQIDGLSFVVVKSNADGLALQTIAFADLPIVKHPRTGKDVRKATVIKGIVQDPNDSEFLIVETIDVVMPANEEEIKKGPAVWRSASSPEKSASIAAKAKVRLTYVDGPMSGTFEFDFDPENFPTTAKPSDLLAWTFLHSTRGEIGKGTSATTPAAMALSRLGDHNAISRLEAKAKRMTYFVSASEVKDGITHVTAVYVQEEDDDGPPYKIDSRVTGK